MAHHKKRKVAKKTTHRRRSMGSIHASKHSLVNGGKLLVGLALGGIVSSSISRVFPTLNPKIISAGKMVAGVMISHNHNPIMSGVGYGIAAEGAIQFSHSLGLLQKAQQYLSGVFDDQANVNGIGISQFVSGLDSEDTVQVPGTHQFNYNDPYNTGTLGRMMGLGS